MPEVLSILVPLYNEEAYVETLLNRVLGADLPDGLEREIIVVDDASTDRSAEIVARFVERHPQVVRLIRADRNQGKGAALALAIEEARGDYAIIQDADLEYNPNEYRHVLEPLLEGIADVVYGSRFLTAGRRRVLYYWHSVANRFLTTLSNIFSGLNLTDMETCYKAFRMSLLKSIPIRSRRFGFEPEITIKIAKRQLRVYEVPISYEGRTYEDGKKIGLKDAFEAVWVLLRFAVHADLYKDEDAAILDAFSVAPRFNAWMADTIQQYVGGEVLEIGAGMGNLTRVLSRRRSRYIATEIDYKHLTRLRNRLQGRANIDIARCDLTHAPDFLPFAEAVETVICLNVLEHIEDDLSALRNIYSALRPGGCALILVPEGQEIYGRMDEVLGHHRRYSHMSLTRRLEEGGFRVERILDFNRVSRPGWYVNGKVLQRTSISRLQLRLFDASVWLWRRVDRFLPWKPTSIIAVARRPEDPLDARLPATVRTAGEAEISR
jgi:glycosyltransferase involved in cell wall biosynthesis/phospholipid N-methyltransferase